MLYISVRGQSSSAEVYFKDSLGNTILPLSPCTYEVRDYNNNLVMSGSATQDPLDTSHWTATFTIPTSAPVGEAGNKYQIKWSLTSTTNQVHVSVEYFLLVAEGEPPPRELSVTMLSYANFVDMFGTSLVPTALTVEIHDIYDNVWMAPTVPTSFTDETPRFIGDMLYYDFDSGYPISNLVAGYDGIYPAFAIWKYDLPGNPGQIEVHPIYVLNSKAFNYINNVRRIVDKARNQDIDPSLSFTDAEIAHYVLSGLARINVSKPQATIFNINTLPDPMSMLLTKAAAFEALDAWYLAEGMKAFNFTGQSVTLEIDRTQYIQTIKDGINTWLEEQIPLAKKVWARSGSGSRYGMGALSVSMWSGTSLPYAVPNQFMSNFRWR